MYTLWQSFWFSVGRNYLFLASNRLRTDLGFQWNMHRLLSLSSKARQISWQTAYVMCIAVLQNYAKFNLLYRLKSSNSKVTLKLRTISRQPNIWINGYPNEWRINELKKRNWIMFIESFISESIISDKDLLSTHQ